MTIVIMGLGTFLIGLLPTYDQIGTAAPILLVLLRLFQGVDLGGEWGGAVLMVVENAPARSRGLLGSMVQMGYPIGNLAAFGALALFSGLHERDFLAWGWRIPFLISIRMAGVGFYNPQRLEDACNCMDDAAFKRDRLHAALGKLKERFKQLREQEDNAQRQVIYDKLKAERDQLAKEYADLYPTVAQKLAEVLSRIAANDR